MLHCQITRQPRRIRPTFVANPALSLENQIIKPLKALNRDGARVLLAVSGGVDSLVMAEVLWRWQKHLKWTLCLAHVHHGHGESAHQNKFRDLAAAHVGALARERGLEFVTNPVKKNQDKSENALRELRRRWLKKWFTEGKYDFILFAHHRDDLLETRVLRLLRGTGSQGLKSMATTGSRVLRPLLDVSRVQITDYASSHQLTWVEDPSNLDVDPLRNWLRSEWLPQLENRQNGATKALARSLELLSEKGLPIEVGAFVGLRREILMQADPQLRGRIVVRYLRSIGVSGYGRSHVQELLKRLNTKRKNFEFEMLGMRFHVTRDLLWASRV